jgi:hydrogenase nickel incorporation protein HypB
MDEVRLIEVKEGILSENKKIAEELRQKLKSKKAYMVNLMASPGAGKTSLILKTIEALRDDYTLGVIEADLDSKVDSEKVAAQGVKAVQLRTGGFCHVDATMVKSGLDAMDTDILDLVILENVGNLVCPAEFETGAIKNAMILSVPEGDDKPLNRFHFIMQPPNPLINPFTGLAGNFKNLYIRINFQHPLPAFFHIKI